MTIYFNTKKSKWKIDIGIWWKQIMFGVWWDSMFGTTEITIKFLFWDIDIWKYQRKQK